MVVGMGGVGCVIATKLHGYECFERIILADVDTTFANQLHERTKKSRFLVLQVNAMETAHLVGFLKEHKIDVILVGLRYVRSMASDLHYQAIRAAIDDIAKKQMVLRIGRYDAEETLAKLRSEQGALMSETGLLTATTARGADAAGA